MVLMEERRSGIWNRVITAGVKPQHFFFAHFFTGSCLMLLQCLEFIVYSYAVTTNRDKLSNMLLVSALLLLTGIGGVLYGLTISAITDSVVVSSCFSLILGFPFVNLSGELRISLAKIQFYIFMFSGIIWPLEGSPSIMQFIGKLLPFTLPSKSFKSLLFTGFALTSPHIYMGFIVNGCWAIGLAALCLWLITKSQSTSKIY
jgi:ABC-type polysaccharide/polyol phosphate export permease